MAALDVDRIKARALAFLKGFSASQLVIIGLLTLVAGVGGVVFLKWVTAPTYAVLLAGLDPADASAVTAKLSSSGVSYQLAAGGATIMVPTGVLDAQRLAVAAAGLPAGKTDSGWAAFDKQGLTSSNFQQQVAYQRAMEATLSGTVGQIQGVRAAEVHLALPEKRLYTDDQKPVRASVLITTDGALGDDAVDAMTHLVASSVPGLQASDVSVTDSTGHLLTGGGSTGGTDRAARTRNELETTLEGRVTTMFDQLLGPGHAVVRVNADMDLADHTTDSETYDPTKQGVLSQSTTEETYATPPGSTVGGTISSVSILPSPTPSPSAGSAGSTPGYVKKTNEQQNGVTRVVQHDVLAPGGIKRLTVTVAVDSNAKNAPAAAQLQAMAASAVGLDPKRGDVITVATPAFLVASPAPTTSAASSGRSTITALAPQVLGGVLLLLVALGLLRTVRRGVTTDLSLAEVSAALDRTGPAALAAGAAGQAALPSGSAPGTAQDGEEGELMTLLDDDDEVAGMLRGWLVDVGGDR